MTKSKRIGELPPYLFVEIDKKKAKAIASGISIIDLGIGDPDLPTPQIIIERLCQEVQNPANHRYPAYNGSKEFRKGISDWYKKRFNVSLDPETEVLAVIGSKEGLAHLVWALVDPCDYTLIPDPAYPVYRIQTILSGGKVFNMPLFPENDFLPDLRMIPADILDKAKILFVNYPNNPTSAIAPIDFLKEVIEFGKRHNIVICSDNAYVETTYDGYVAPSILQIPGALDIAVEFYSFSKPFNMTGWRIGAAVGNKNVISKLSIIKTNTDSSQFTAIQHAALAGFTIADEFLVQMNNIYKERRDILVGGLNSLGWLVKKPKGSLYVWAPVPKGYNSVSFSTMLLEKAGVIVTPGVAYGSNGKDFVRMSLTTPKEQIREFIERLSDLNLGL
ncbi:MAG: LL-diaminopimelate aminotransferase [Bacillota bacterium]|nr:LL-diaminopimelate aminotransferase [Bacillota bacterium]